MDLSKWDALAIIAIALGFFGGISLNLYFTNQLSIEAIKAGLVQDSKGNWAKPPVHVEAPKP